MRFKVLQIVDVIEGEVFGGGAKVVHQIAKGLDKQRYKSMVACASNGLFADMLRKAGVEVVEANMSSKHNVLLIPRLAKFMKQRGISVVHTHGPRSNFFGRIAARLAGVPVIVSTVALTIGRESYADVSKFRRSTYLLIDKLTSVYVNRFLVLSELHRDALAADYDIAPGRIRKIYNGIELAEYDANEDNGRAVRRELGIDSSSPIVGFIGRLVQKQKGLPFLLQAAAKVKAVFPNGNFLIVGDGPLKAELESLANDLNIFENCFFTGFREDIPDILSAIDMLVMSSLYEGMPMVILEAMAASKPVIATRVGGIPELVKDGETGILVPPKDVDALADNIIALLKNKDKAQQMGLAGRKRVQESFDVKTMVKKTEAVYGELLKRRLRE